jgi:hypothetical protein
VNIDELSFRISAGRDSPDPRKKRRLRAIRAPLLASARLTSDRAGRFAIDHG